MFRVSAKLLNSRLFYLFGFWAPKVEPLSPKNSLYVYTYTSMYIYIYILLCQGLPNSLEYDFTQTHHRTNARSGAKQEVAASPRHTQAPSPTVAGLKHYQDYVPYSYLWYHIPQIYPEMILVHVFNLQNKLLAQVVPSVFLLRLGEFLQIGCLCHAGCPCNLY